jgi:hypothetical protein
MPLPARIPDSLAHLDVGIVAAALIRHDANVRNTARALDVPSGDLRKLVLADQRLAEAALEAVELRLDDAEANLSEALHCGDPRRRDAVSMFMLRNTQRASKRGYAVAASAASLEVGLVDREPRQIIVSWRNPGEEKSDGDDGWETIERDGQNIRVPRYDGARRDDDIEGELSLPATMLEHAAAVEPEHEPVVPDPAPPGPDPAIRYERERIDAWIRNRLIAYPLASCFGCRKPIVAGAAWEEVSNGDTNARARFHRDCHAEWRAEQEAAARQALGLEG